MKSNIKNIQKSVRNALNLDLNAKNVEASKKERARYIEIKERTYESGVMLLVLGITIVVILIMAGITKSVLTGEHGMINEASNATIQSETAKVHEGMRLYLMNKEIEKPKQEIKPSVQEQLKGIVINVTSIEISSNGEQEMNLGVISDFKALQIESKYGKGYEDVKEGELGGSMLDNLHDVFVIDYATHNTYYIRNGRIWSVKGEVGVEEVAQKAEEANKDIKAPTNVKISKKGKTIKGTATDNQTGIDKYQFSTETNLAKDSEGWKDANGSIQFTISEEVEVPGTYYFYVKDKAGNMTRSSNSVTVTENDINPPVEPETVQVKLNFIYYDESTKGQKTETKSVEVEKGKEGSITPPSISKTMINDKEATPKGWATSQKGKVEKGVSEDITVTEADNTKTYYMIYTYEVNIKIPNPETGEMEDKKVEVEVDSSGEKIPSTGEEGEQNGEIKLPETAKPPKELEGQEGEDAKFEGWVKKDKDGETPGPNTEPMAPGTTVVPDEGDEYLPKFTKTVKVKRHIHEDTMPELEGKIISIGNTITPATVVLGTTTGYQQQVGEEMQEAKPKGWSKTKGATAKVEVLASDDAQVQVTEDTDFYMLYSIIVKKQYVTDPSNPDETETKDTEVLVDPDGNKTLGDENEEDKPTTPIVPDELKGEGYGNATDENGNQQWTTDPKDPSKKETDDDESQKLYPVYEKEITVTRYIHNSTMPVLKGKVYKTGDPQSTITPATVVLGTTTGYQQQVGEEMQEAKPKGWSKTKGATAKVEVLASDDAQVQVTEDTDFYMLYSITVKKQYVTDPSNPDGTETKDTEVLVDPDGNKTLGDENEEDKPTTPIVPDELKGEGYGNATDENGNQQWTTDPNDPSKKETNDDESQKLYPVYSRKITVTRNIYKGTLDSITGIIYTTAGQDAKVTSISVNLGKDDKNSSINGKSVKQLGWAQTTGADDSIEVGLDGEPLTCQDIQVSENRNYYAIYETLSSNTTFKYWNPNEGDGKTETEVITINVKVNYQGTEGQADLSSLKIPEVVSMSKGPENTEYVYICESASDGVLDGAEVQAESLVAGKTYAAVYKRKIAVTKVTYDDSKKVETREEIPDTNVIGYFNGTHKKVSVILGQAKPVSIESNGQTYTAQPRGWTKGTDGVPAGNSNVDVNLIQSVELLESSTYYMTYDFNATATFISPQHPEGNTLKRGMFANSQGTVIGTEEFSFPDDPTADQSWGERWTFKGWTKGETSHPKEEIVSKETEKPVKDTIYVAAFQKEITIERYVYDEENNKQGKKVDNDITKTIYKSTKYTDTEEVNLETTDNIQVQIGKNKYDFEPKAWAKDNETLQAETLVNPNNKIEPDPLENAKYYMIYEKNLKFNFVNPDGTTPDPQITQTIKVTYNDVRDGEKVTMPKEPTTPIEWEGSWEFHGWSNGSDNPEEIIDLKDGELLDPEATYYGAMKKTITVTKNVFNGTPEGTTAEPQEGTVYKNSKTTKKAQITLTDAPEIQVPLKDAVEPNTIQASFRGWVEKDGLSNASTVEQTVELETDTAYDATYKYNITVTFKSPNGEEETKNPTTYVSYKGVKTADPSTSVPDPTSPSDDWSTFVGWSKEETPGEKHEDPKLETEPNKTYHAIYKKQVKVTRMVYENTEMEDQAHAMEGTAYKNDVKEVPFSTNLGKPADVSYTKDSLEGTYTATPSKWTTTEKDATPEPDTCKDLNAPIETTNNITYYAVYTYHRMKTGEGNKLQNQEIYLASDGTTEEGETEDRENPVAPDGDNTWNFKGWVDSETPLTGPYTNVNQMDPSKDYYSVWTRDVTAQRYVYQGTDGGTKLEDLPTQPVYKCSDGKREIKATFTLAEHSYQASDYNYAGYEWGNATALESPKAADPGGQVEIIKTTPYYMKYNYEVKATFYYNNNNGADVKKANAKMNYAGQEKQGVDPGKPENPTKDGGYTFDGWRTSESVGGEAVTPGAITQNTSYYGSYKYNIGVVLWSYDSGTEEGKSSTKSAQSYVNYKDIPTSQQIDLGNPTETPDGYSFVGWTTDENNPKGATVTGNQTLTATNNTYYATYKKEVNAKFYWPDGKEYDETGNYTKVGRTLYMNHKRTKDSSGTIAAPNAEKTPWTFWGWSKEQDIKGAKAEDYGSIEAETTYYASYTNPVTVRKHDKSGDTSVPNVERTMNYAGTTNKGSLNLGTPTSAGSGFTSLGWTTENSTDTPDYTPAGQTVELDIAKDTADYYARYTKDITVKKHWATTDGAEGTASADVKATRIYNYNATSYSGGKAKLETPPILTDWEFRGWSTDTSATANTTNNGQEEVTLEEATPYYASYKRDVTVTYDTGGDGASTCDPSHGTATKNYAGVETKATITLPKAPTKDNFDFQGWTDDSNRTEKKWGASTGQQFIKKDNTVYAVWKQKGYYCTVCKNTYEVKHYDCEWGHHCKYETSICNTRLSESKGVLVKKWSGYYSGPFSNNRVQCDFYTGVYGSQCQNNSTVFYCIYNPTDKVEHISLLCEVCGETFHTATHMSNGSSYIYLCDTHKEYLNRTGFRVLAEWSHHTCKCASTTLKCTSR